MSEKTVSAHLSRITAKLGASRRAEAVANAFDRACSTCPADAAPDRAASDLRTTRSHPAG
ncbi:LuxR C-terminal-related transcriptional regulator [Saccharothrix sp. MB29]|nr:LuxR C-terminal-related transcriptional regulator [Saccharothrix sp. MB29]